MPDSEGILGHADVLARLLRATGEGTLHHAYLFEGPRGIGKRRVALELAMVANCTADGARPCRRCASCRRIASGAHPDVIVLEPNPERATPIIPVDAVREVVRLAGFHRYDARRRVVIVDPAEAMADPAANALLKTLEEPPPGTGFVLLAENPRALLPTIVSRCQRVRFRPVPEADIVGWLEAQGLGVQAAAAARLSEGCPGRALELAEGGVEQWVTLRAELLEALGGQLGGVFAFTSAKTRGSRSAWLPTVEKLLRLVEDLVRDAAIRGAGSEVPLRNADRPDLVDAWAAALWPSGITAVQTALDDAREDLLVNVSGKLVLDALLTRLATELGRARTAA